MSMPAKDGGLAFVQNQCIYARVRRVRELDGRRRVEDDIYAAFARKIKVVEDLQPLVHYLRRCQRD